MNASLSEISTSPVSVGREDALRVPPRWRVGQLVVIAVVVALAMYYNLVGWRSVGANPAGDSRASSVQIGFVLLGLLAWLTTPNAGVIAQTTLQEAIRRRWVISLLAFSTLLLASSSLLVGLQPGEEEKFLRDFGIGFIITMTLLMSIFLGVALVPPEIERRTIFTILSKPVTRNEFIIGKFLGLCATLALFLAVMGTVFLMSYALFQTAREGWSGALAVDVATNHLGLGFDLRNLVFALVLHMGQLAVMAALGLTLSLVVSSITAIVFCFLAYFGGQMSSYWQNLGDSSRTLNETSPQLSRAMQGIVNVVYWMLPRLDHFDVREALVNDSMVQFSHTWKAWNNGLIYSAVLLVIAALMFSDREF